MSLILTGSIAKARAQRAIETTDDVARYNVDPHAIIKEVESFINLSRRYEYLYGPWQERGYHLSMVELKVLCDWAARGLAQKED